MFVLLLLALLAVVAVVATGRGDAMPEPVRDRVPLGLSEDAPVDAGSLAGLRFSLGFRGYRMDQVDAVLERLGSELTARDARIRELEGELHTQQSPAAREA